MSPNHRRVRPGRSASSGWTATSLAAAIDLDLWRNIAREYSEELLGEPEHDGSRGTPQRLSAGPHRR